MSINSLIDLVTVFAFQALSGASYDYMKVCVNELRKQLQDLESNANQTLLQDALRNTSDYQSSDASSETDLPSSSNNDHHHRRRNPFNPDDSIEGEHDRQTMVEKHARTFLEMHKELRDEIDEITKHWLISNPHSKAALLIDESAA